MSGILTRFVRDQHASATVEYGVLAASAGALALCALHALSGQALGISPAVQALQAINCQELHVACRKE